MSGTGSSSTNWCQAVTVSQRSHLNCSPFHLSARPRHGFGLIAAFSDMG
jgi:hypothetical protein